MKKCDNCNKPFRINNIGSGGQNRMYCYECYPEGLSKRERSDLRYQLLREKANKAKMEIGCKLCGYNKTGYALDWHHHNDDKNYEPSNLLKRSWKAYQKEIAKCVLLCSNCHREVHYGVTEL
ncbi:hypothetical protein [Bacillus phage vB_BanS-Thrax2]|nr:hypothetical protein [Bacillus phage vB_BanS-Thrax2]